MQIVISPLDPNAVNPVVPAAQAPTVNVHTGNVEPGPKLPAPAAGLDAATGNMLRAERGTPHGGPEPAFPNPPSVITDTGHLYQVPPSNT